MSTAIEPVSPTLDEEDELAELGLAPHSRVIRIPAYVRDFDSFRDWTASPEFPDFGRISWIGDEIEIDMNAENIEFHNSVKTCLLVSLGLLIDAEDRGQYFGDGVRLVHVPTRLSCEPDFVFCSWAAFQTGRVGYQTGAKNTTETIELQGTPDLVVEVVSPSSVTKDKRKHPQEYFAAGIPEYWIVDARKKEIDFRILVAGQTEYSESERDNAGFAASRVFQRGFRLSRTRNQVGNWKYLLEHQSTGAAPADG